MEKLMAVKDSGGKEVIMEVGLAVIGVALLILFRKHISELVSNILNTAENKINNLFDGATVGNVTL